jgi:hypothetical protein
LYKEGILTAEIKMHGKFVGKPLEHDWCDHLYGTTSLDKVIIKNHKSKSKFDSEIRVARNVISVI